VAEAALADPLGATDEFIVDLKQSLSSMLMACEDGDLKSLIRLGQSLMEQGQQAGCAQAAELAAKIVSPAESGDLQQVGSALDDLALLAESLTHGLTAAQPSPAPPAIAPADELWRPVVRGDFESQAPIFSSLPADDDDFRAIIVGFIKRLQEQAHAMSDAWQRNDWSELAQLAHWLKGAGGTVGFDCFTEPARRLEQHAKHHSVQLIEPVLLEVLGLISCVALPVATRHPETGPTATCDHSNGMSIGVIS